VPQRWSERNNRIISKKEAVYLASMDEEFLIGPEYDYTGNRIVEVATSQRGLLRSYTGFWTCQRRLIQRVDPYNFTVALNTWGARGRLRKRSPLA
jgi:hypothetical protein